MNNRENKKRIIKIDMKYYKGNNITPIFMLPKTATVEQAMEFSKRVEVRLLSSDILPIAISSNIKLIGQIKHSRIVAIPKAVKKLNAIN